MTGPILERPAVGSIDLRNGEKAFTVRAGGQAVIVRADHLAVLIDDLVAAEEATA